MRPIRERAEANDRDNDPFTIVAVERPIRPRVEARNAAASIN
jgi:hypothetical protein